MIGFTWFIVTKKNQFVTSLNDLVNAYGLATIAQIEQQLHSSHDMKFIEMELIHAWIN